VKQANVEHEGIAGSNSGPAQRSYVSAQKPDVKVGILGARLRFTKCLLDQIDAGYLPAAPSQLDRMHSGPAPHIEGFAIGRLPFSLFAVEQRTDLLSALG
jgi:hypothetical protein